MYRKQEVADKMTKGRFVFRLIAGGYLGYLGISLVKDAMTERPDSYILYTVLGVLFAVIGIGWLLLAVRTYMKEGLQDPDGGGTYDKMEEETDAAPEEIVEKSVEDSENGNNIEDGSSTEGDDSIEGGDSTDEAGK